MRAGDVHRPALNANRQNCAVVARAVSQHPSSIDCAGRDSGIDGVQRGAQDDGVVAFAPAGLDAQAVPVRALVTGVLAEAHARARAFDVASLLRTPFASAVKTGTSSDFRDTWTVGFTRDYTVATWVGNFDGAPMQRVTGVTGAAPLWNRIIRHLAERVPPPPFAAPRGYARKPMCATTGVRPTRDCDSVVSEWLDARDRVAWNSPPRPLDRTYDGWLAAQRPRRGEALRIVAPHDGDVFVAAPGARIAVVARGAAEPAWELNGKRVAAHGARWTLPLARGRWTLRARDGARADAVTFTVGDPVPRGRRVGFTVR